VADDKMQGSMRLRRKSGALLVPLLILALLVPVSAQALILPPELVVLEQRMAQLHVHSERFSASLVGFCAPHLGPSGCDRGEGQSLLFAVSGASGFSPRIGTFHVRSARKRVEVRLIGDVTYSHRPEVARFDGRRPWVRHVGFKADDLLAFDPTGLFGGALGGTLGNYRHLIGFLGEAQSVVDAGPVLVAGQQSTEFDATFAGGQPILEERTGTLRLFLAPSGLPVRAALTTSGGDFYTLRLTNNTLAINLPVHVKAPPARKTIDQTRLDKLEARRKHEP
jgi:hypothetical protein